jgi:homoserine O-succinyltransferase
VYPFSLPALERSGETRQYIEQHYSRFDELRQHGLDALIITGANVANPRLPEEAFWDPLMEVARWAENNVASVLCSCLATHALLHHGHAIERRPLPEKRWGVFSHTLRDADHPLVYEINTRFDVPHSRHNDISREQLESAGLQVLAESEAGGVHLAVSPDLARIVYFQGHPEYDRNSLLKEYQREVRRFLAGQRSERPPLPENYFSAEAAALIERAWRQPETVETVLRNDIEPLLDNTWGDTAKAVFNNWLGMVYQLTNLDRHQQYMPGVDRDDPLGLNAQGAQAP